MKQDIVRSRLQSKHRFKGTNGDFLELGSSCDKDSSQWEFTSRNSIKQLSSGLCWHPQGGKEDSEDGTKVVIFNGCDVNRLQFTWVTGALT